MRFHVLTLRFPPTLGIIDPAPLDELGRHFEIVSLKEHFFSVEGIPHLVCVVATQEALSAQPDGLTSGASGRGREGGKKRKDPTADLNEAERRLFNTLRNWRARKAEKEGVPRYIVFTNEELVALIRKRPSSRTAISQMDGIGPKKTERYADDLLSMLAMAQVGSVPPRNGPSQSEPPSEESA